MISFLRFLGVANAAVWLGAAVFVTCLAGPAFFSPAMLAVFGGQRYYAGAAAEIFLSRYFVLHHVCAGFALLHLLAERFYLGRNLTRTTLALWFLLVALTLGGGLVAQPKMRALHREMYFSAPAAQASAKKAFGLWHGLAQTANLLVTVSLLGYFWRITHPRRTWDASEI
ncbi:MAG: hypothetical protein RL380_1717 [Verrucomicrobiota bacterium]